MMNAILRTHEAQLSKKLINPEEAFAIKTNYMINFYKFLRTSFLRSEISSPGSALEQRSSFRS